MGNVMSIQLCDGSEITMDELKSVIATKPHSWDDEKPSQIDFTGYEDCFSALGFEILEWIICGSYQGDYVCLLRKNGRYYFTVIGYGSCSGCDHYERSFGWSIDDTDEEWGRVASFIEEYHSNVKGFDTIGELQEYLKGCLFEGRECNDWWIYDSDVKVAMTKISMSEY